MIRNMHINFKSYRYVMEVSEVIEEAERELRRHQARGKKIDLKNPRRLVPGTYIAMHYL